MPFDAALSLAFATSRCGRRPLSGRAAFCFMSSAKCARHKTKPPHTEWCSPSTPPHIPQAAIVSLAKQQQQQQLLCDTFGNAFLNCKETKRNVAATKQQQQQEHQQRQEQRERREKVFSIFSHCLRTELHLKSAPVKNFESNDYKRSSKNYATRKSERKLAK